MGSEDSLPIIVVPNDMGDLRTSAFDVTEGVTFENDRYPSVAEDALFGLRERGGREARSRMEGGGCGSGKSRREQSRPGNVDFEKSTGVKGAGRVVTCLYRLA